MAKAAQAAIEQMETPVEELPPAPKVSRRKLIIGAVAIVALLCAMGGALWHFISEIDDLEDEAPVNAKVTKKGTEKTKPGDKTKEKKASVYMPLDTFVVNLRSEGTDRFLQTAIVFEVTDDKTAEAIKSQMPAIRSKLLLLLSSKTPAELNTLQGKEKLAAEIASEARKRFSVRGPDQALTQVHFNAFVIQ